VKKHRNLCGVFHMAFRTPTKQLDHAPAESRLRCPASEQAMTTALTVVDERLPIPSSPP
jgi:hypothetical protein